MLTTTIEIIDSMPGRNQPLCAKYKRSFAYATFKERLPSVVQDAIDRLMQKPMHVMNSYSEKAFETVPEIVRNLLALVDEMINDRKLVALHADELLNVSDYNDYIASEESKGNKLTFYSAPWLFAECYMYRKIYEIFADRGLKKYDPFLEPKIETFIGGKDAELMLANILKMDNEQLKGSEDLMKKSVIYFTKCSLWGNKVDLSLSGGKSMAIEGVFQKMGEMDPLILVDHSEAAYHFLRNLPADKRRIDIVLDNAGYELYNDLVLADFLINSGLARKVVFHGKAIPWFVSDVTAFDFINTLQMMEECLCDPVTTRLANTWKKFVAEGKWEMKCDPFWVSHWDYSHMKGKKPSLYEELSESGLIIFKGDLNYRKLVGDIYWETTEPFRCGLRGFEPAPFVALRTIKSETVCGLPAGVADTIGLKDPGWMITGKYGLIQFNN